MLAQDERAPADRTPGCFACNLVRVTRGAVGNEIGAHHRGREVAFLEPLAGRKIMCGNDHGNSGQNVRREWWRTEAREAGEHDEGHETPVFSYSTPHVRGGSGKCASSPRER